MKTQRLGFTLVELIVVIVILWVLATIGFVSYNGYLAWARDGNRITQLRNLNDSLNLYSTDKDLPLPDDYVTVQAGSNVVGYQWVAGINTLDLIDYKNGGTDPRDDGFFTYYLSGDRKKVQLLTFLEETDNLQASLPFVSQTHAVDFSNRFPKVFGSKLGVLTLTSNKTPINQVWSISTAGALDISTTTTIYTAHISDSVTVEWDSSVLAAATPGASCKRLKEVWDADW